MHIVLTNIFEIRPVPAFRMKRFLSRPFVSPENGPVVLREDLFPLREPEYAVKLLSL